MEESQALAEKIRLITEEKTRLTSMTGLLKQQIAAYDKQVKPLKAQNRELNDKITVLQVVKLISFCNTSIFSDSCILSNAKMLVSYQLVHF